jgi:hypothetical protein
VRRTDSAALISRQQLCQRQLRAPEGQRVRLAIDTVDLAPGAFLLVFDGATSPSPGPCCIM